MRAPGGLVPEPTIYLEACVLFAKTRRTLRSRFPGLLFLSLTKSQPFKNKVDLAVLEFPKGFGRNGVYLQHDIERSGRIHDAHQSEA